MKLAEIISAAASAYPDGVLHRCRDAGNVCVAGDSGGGDTLALFIVRELRDTYDPEADDAEQVATAVNALETARADLRGAMDAIGGLAEGRWKGGD